MLQSLSAIMHRRELIGYDFVNYLCRALRAFSIDRTALIVIKLSADGR